MGQLNAADAPVRALRIVEVERFVHRLGVIVHLEDGRSLEMSARWDMENRPKVGSMYLDHLVVSE